MNTRRLLPGEMPRAGLPDLPALTSLRFIAAFAVLVLHYRDLLGPMPDWLLHIVIGGQYGVTFFFVLSGFILTYRYDDWFRHGVSDARYWRFQRLRLARIYPVYLVGLLLDTPWHLLERAQAGQLADVGTTWWASWLLNLVGLQAWVPAVPFAMFWNTPAWSVAAEFFFYASFPFVCAALGRLRLGKAALIVGHAGVVLAGVGLYAAVIYGLTYVTRVNADTQYIVLVYNPLLRYSEFLGGCLAGQFFLRHMGASPASLTQLLRRERWRNAAVCAALALIGWRVCSSDYTGPSAELWLLDVALKYGIFIIPFTMLILAIASGRSWLSGLLERRWMVALGEASYSLYIIHWSAITFIRMGYLGPYGGPAVHAVVLVATAGLSVLVYRFIEVPWRRRWRGTGDDESMAVRADERGPWPAALQAR